jgi:hypothetical protein
MTKLTPLYEFSVVEKTEKQVKKPQTIDGKEAVVETTEMVESPVKFFFKKPSRIDVREAELFYAMRVNYYIQEKKLMTRAMLLNKYSDNGGLISDSSAKELAKVQSRLFEVQEELVIAGSQPKKAVKQKVKKLKEEFAALQNQIVELHQYKTSLFALTAESKAETDLSTWFAVNFIYFQRENDDFQKMFEGSDFDSQERAYFELDENPTPLYEAAKEKITLASALYAYNMGITAEEFSSRMESIEKMDEKTEDDG